MTRLRIELSKDDIKRIVLEHLDEEYRLSEHRRIGRAYDGVSITWTEDGGLIFERDDERKDPKATNIPVGGGYWEALNGDDNGT